MPVRVVNKAAVRVGQKELDARKRRLFIRARQLLQDERTQPPIPEGQLIVAALDNDFPGSVVANQNHEKRLYEEVEEYKKVSNENNVLIEELETQTQGKERKDEKSAFEEFNAADTKYKEIYDETNHLKYGSAALEHHCR